MDQNAQPGRGGRDIRGDKRKEETVVLSSDNVADMVAQAKAEAAAVPPAPEAAPAPTPAASPAPASPAPASPTPASAKSNTGGLGCRHAERADRLGGVKSPADTEVGRDCEPGILLDDPAVSRRHLRLEPTDDGLVVVDLGSANGTTVDGERLTDPRLLRPGSRLRLGETEIMVHEGHAGAGDQAAAGAAELSERPSEGARRLSKTAASGIGKGSFRRRSG